MLEFFGRWLGFIGLLALLIAGGWGFFWSITNAPLVAGGLVIIVAAGVAAAEATFG